MKIAILGWGSLLWEPDVEFDKWHDQPWRPEGPMLKLEFSRISSTRLGALTLVIDQAYGQENTVAYCMSGRALLEDAVADLRCREGSPVRTIGYIFPSSGEGRCRDKEIAETIATWCTRKKYDAVVWTDLESNFSHQRSKNGFHEKKDVRFSVAAAISHLQGLNPEGKTKAVEYVRRAPTFIKTPLRTALQGQPWFA